MRALFFSLLLASACAFAAVDKNRVYVAANANDAASVELARFYCGMRGVPAANIILLDIPEHLGTVSRGAYVEKIETPLFAALVKNGAIDAMDMGVSGNFGARELLLTRVNADFLVLCKGVPWAISDQQPSAKRINGVKTAEASVDSEISARFLSRKTFSGPLRNPAFGASDDRWSAFGLLRVARLDGKTYADVKRALEGALRAETRGLRGRAYIDIAKKNKLGDGWLAAAAEVLKAEGYDVSVEDTPALFGFGGRFDAPALYFGWYSFFPCGYFKLGDFSCADGMMGWHIYSFSARTFADLNYWAPMFVSKKAAATDGNVFEPYLALTRNISVFVKLVFEKKMLPSEAAFAALPALSWQSVYLGDPLYNPLKKTLGEQLADIAAGDVDGLSQYALVRRANQIAAQKSPAEAAEYLSKFAGKLPDDVALRWRIAQLSSDAEKIKAARQLLAEKIHKNAQYVGLSFEAARLLSGAGFGDVVLAHAEDVFKTYNSCAELRRFAALSAASAAKRCGKEVSAGVRAELEIAELERRQKEEARLKKLSEKSAPSKK